LSFGGKYYKFDKELIHGNGKLYAADLKPILKQYPMKQVSPEAANLAMSFDKFDSLMGHPNNAVLKETSKAHNIQLTDVHHIPCQHCAKAKIRMKNIPKENDNIATKKGERLLIDISWIRTATYADNRYWLLVMDEYTNFLWSFFMKTKDETKHHVITLILDLQKDKNITVNFIRCDHSGETKYIQQAIIPIPKIKVKFEFTAPDTPQQNGKIERKFATMYGKVRATLNEAEFTWPLRRSMWAYCALLITKMDNALIHSDVHLSPYELFYNYNPAWPPHLHSFGEIAIAKKPKKIQAKLKNRGSPAICLGPGADHKEDVYSFWNPKTRQCNQSFPAVFLKVKYSCFYKMDKEEITHQIVAVHDELGEMYDSDEDVILCDDDGNHLATAEDDASSHHSDPPAMDASSVTLEGSDSTEDSAEFLPSAIQNNLSGIPREVRNLTSFFNPNPEQWANLQGDLDSDTALIATMYDGNPEPKTYAKALKCNDFQN
jgi:hypothetical protein